MGAFLKNKTRAKKFVFYSMNNFKINTNKINWFIERQKDLQQKLIT